MMMKMIGAHSAPVRVPFQPSHLVTLNQLVVHHPDRLHQPQVGALQPVADKVLLTEVVAHLQVQHPAHLVVRHLVVHHVPPVLPNLR